MGLFRLSHGRVIWKSSNSSTIAGSENDKNDEWWVTRYRARRSSGPLYRIKAPVANDTEAIDTPMESTLIRSVFCPTKTAPVVEIAMATTTTNEDGETKSPMMANDTTAAPAGGVYPSSILLPEDEYVMDDSELQLFMESYLSPESSRQSSSPQSTTSQQQQEWTGVDLEDLLDQFSLACSTPQPQPSPAAPETKHTEVDSSSSNSSSCDDDEYIVVTDSELERILRKYYPSLTTLRLVRSDTSSSLVCRPTQTSLVDLTKSSDAVDDALSSQRRHSSTTQEEFGENVGNAAAATQLLQRARSKLYCELKRGITRRLRRKMSRKRRNIVSPTVKCRIK